MSLSDNKPVTVTTTIEDPQTRMSYDSIVWALRIGQATGTSLLYHFGAIFGGILREFVSKARPMSDEERTKLSAILSRPAR
jgi:hypothetical protein